MNNLEMMFFSLFGILCALAGFFAMRIHVLVTAIFEQRRRRKEFPYIEEATTENICKGPHTWDKTKLVFPELPVDTYRVCTECGFVSEESGDKKLNKPAIEVYRGHIKRRDARLARWDAAFKKKQEIANEIMNRMIKAHVGNLGPDLHANIEVLQQFFRKSNIELDSLYSTLNKELDEEGQGG